MLFVYGAAVLFVLFTATWLLQLKTGNAAIVDTIWSASFPVLAILYFALTDGHNLRKIIMTVMVIAWGLRLALYLFIRTIGHPEDARYTALRAKWGVHHNAYMLRFFYFQAILALVLSLPFALVMSNPDPVLKVVEWMGVAVWTVAVVGESLSDYQLKKFKADPSNKGKICDVGLWYYSRHPNYFFEWLIWVSYFIFATGSPMGFLSILCPAAILYFLLKVTGIPYTEEQTLKSKGDAYRKYQASTSAFVPWPKKRIHS